MSRYHRYAAVGFAILLILVLRLTPEEVCGLSRSSFSYLSDFPKRLTVTISHVFGPRVDEHGDTGKYCLLSDVTDVAHVRRLELPMLLRIYYEVIICGYSGTRRLPCADGTDPLLRPETHPDRRMTPKELTAEIDRVLAEIRLPKHTEIKTGKVSRIALLQNTAEHNLRRYSYEEEEMRYVMAKAPQLVSAKHYSDFNFEAEINKRGAMQDRWMDRFLPAFLTALSEPQRQAADRLLPAALEEPVKLKKRDSQVVVAGPDAGKLTEIRIRMTIQPRPEAELPEQGLLLELNALRGVTGVVKFNAEKGEQPKNERPV